MAYTTIDNPSEHFKAVTYTGNGTEPRNIDVDFQSDFVWVKDRTIAYYARIFDSNRVGAGPLYPSETVVEDHHNDGPEIDFSSPYSNGFKIIDNPDGTTNSYGVNQNSSEIISWNWKANGGTTSTNNDGAVTSTVQANQTAGFSILTYTMNSNSNETVGHGLGVAPEVVITKARQRGDSNGFWSVYTTMIDGSLDYLKLNTTDTVSNSSLSAPTSTVFTGAGSSTASYRSFVAYCFKGIQGYSKFGRYLGTGNANGSFIYTGFKPRWVMVKETGTANSWWMFDTARDTYNTADARLVANTSDAEATGSFTNVVDFLSNGLKFRNSDSAWNGYNRTYFYMCFAENPFVSSDGVPTTAR
jgi:hypothetical protein